MNCKSNSWILPIGVWLFFTITIHIGYTDARGRSGGSFRSSGSRSSRSSGSGSIRSSGSKSTSRYVSYIPSYRYSRGYSNSRLGHYAYYYNMYFAYSGSSAYLRRTRPGTNQGVCVNYEASENNTVMGVFTCPLPFEPSEFTACCGQDYAEYCCSVPISTTAIIGGVFGSLVLIFCLAGAIRLCAKGNCNCNKKVQPSERRPDVVTRGRNPPRPPVIPALQQSTNQQPNRNVQPRTTAPQFQPLQTDPYHVNSTTGQGIPGSPPPAYSDVVSYPSYPPPRYLDVN